MTGVVNIAFQEEDLTAPAVERAVLGHLLRAPENWVAGCLILEDFTVESNRKILEALAAVVARGEAICQVALACEAAKRFGLEQVGGIQAILDLDDAADAHPDLAPAIETLRSLSLRRQLFDLARWLWRESQHSTADPGHTLRELHVQLAALNLRWLL